MGSSISPILCFTKMQQNCVGPGEQSATILRQIRDSLLTPGGHISYRAYGARHVYDFSISMLFCLLAIVILNSVLWGVISAYGAFIFLALLSLFFSLAVLIISKLPVPERFSVGFLALIMVGVALSVLVFLILPAFGGILLAASLLGFVIVLLPRTWKSSTKMALRNIGRQRARTTTTMLALFVGVFAIGLILALGQDVRDTVNNAAASGPSSHGARPAAVLVPGSPR